MIRSAPYYWIECDSCRTSAQEDSDFDAAWVRSLRDQCQAAGVPYFFKQWGGRTPKAGGRELDGRTWDEDPAVAA